MIPLGETGARWEPACGPTRNAVVFVHGFEGDHITTWRPKKGWFDKDEPRGLIDYLSADAALPWECFSMRHTGGVFNSATISDIAGTLRTFLHDHVYPTHDVVALVAHSLGGLACRQLILTEIQDPKNKRAAQKIAGLLMFGTPNDGASVAKAAARFGGSASGADMQPYGERLLELNRQWLERVINGGRRDFDVDERAPLVCWNVVGTSDRVVTQASAQHLALLGDVWPVPYGHTRMTKPSSDKDSPVMRVREFLDAVARSFRDRRREIAAELLADEVHARSLGTGWVTTEEETIKLEELTPAEKAQFPSGDVYRVTVTTARTDVACSDNVVVGLRVDSAEYPAGTAVEFDLQVGKGVAGNALDDAFRGADDLKTFAYVNSVQATHGGQPLVYQAQQPVKLADGVFKLPFRCDQFPAGSGRLDRLEVSLTSYVDLAMGWWTYFCPHTVTDRLTVTFTAPFPTSCLMQEPLRSAADKEPNQFGKKHVMKVTAETPIAPQTRITFVFRR